MGKMPEGMLNIKTRRASGERHSNRAQTTLHQQPSRVTDDTQPRQRQQDSNSIDHRLEFTDYTIRERIANKWNALKQSCWRRRESMQLEESIRPNNSEALATQPAAAAGAEIFSVSCRVSVAASSTPPQLTVHETPPRVINRRNLRSQLPGSKPAPVVVSEVDLVTRSGRDNDDDTGSARIVFGRERTHVFDLLRQRTAAFCVFLKQKFHSRTLNIDNSVGQESIVTPSDTGPPPVHTRRPTGRLTQATEGSLPAVTTDPEFIARRLNANRIQTTRSESTDSDKDEPVQNLAIGSKPAKDQFRLRCEVEDTPQLTAAVRKANSVPAQRSITTAIIHQEQSPWLQNRDNGDDNAMNVSKDLLQRAKSMNFNTGKSTKTSTSHLCDDTNVRYNCRPQSIQETSTDAKLLDAVTANRLASSSSFRAASAAAVELLETERHQNAVNTMSYTGVVRNNNTPDSVPSEAQSDYQLPMSVGSDQWSSYDPCLGGPRVNDDRGNRVELAAGKDLPASKQCYGDAEGPFYVNTAELAADVADRDGAGNEYMRVQFTYSADDEADNVYLSLLDIISIEERQIQVSYTLPNACRAYRPLLTRNNCRPSLTRYLS